MMTLRPAAPQGCAPPGYEPDSDLTARAAEALRISEFDLFRLAYRTWHGEDPETQRIEKVFAAYLFNQTVPSWLRHFCRDVLAQTWTEAWEGTRLRAYFGADNLRYREPLPDLTAKSPAGRFVREFAYCGLLILFLVAI